MPAPLISKDEAIDRLFASFRDHGYGGATLSELSRGTGLGRSSLYHHFPGGKEDMAVAVLDRVALILRATLEAALAAPGGPRARLAGGTGRTGRHVCRRENPCVLASFAQGEARVLFQRRLIDLFQLWVEGFATLAREAGVPARQARERAEDAVGAIEGALILAAGLNDIAPFRRRLASLPCDLLGNAP